MRRELGSFICSVIFAFSACGQEVEELGRNVVGIEVYQLCFEQVGTNLLQVVYRKPDGAIFPKTIEMGRGTGFFIQHHHWSYVVTAKHVPGTNTEANLLLINKDGMRVTLSLEEIRHYIPGAKWFSHPTADVVLHPYFWPTNLNINNLDFTDDNLRTNALALLAPVASVGFPFGLATEAFPIGLGVRAKVSPVATECQLASWLTVLPNQPINLAFILLDKTLAQGYSGAPIYTRPNVIKGDVLLAPFHAEIIGLCSQTAADVSGGKLASSFWRNLLLNAKSFGLGAALSSMGGRYPRERLFNALPLLLWNGESLQDSDVVRHLQRQLHTRAEDWAGLVAAYTTVWPSYG